MRYKKAIISTGVVIAILVIVLVGYTMTPLFGLDTVDSSVGGKVVASVAKALAADTYSIQGLEEVEDAIPVADKETLPTYEYVSQEITVENQGQKISGIAYIPQYTSVVKHPLVICSPGLDEKYESLLGYATELASHGVATYCFDFRGGNGTNCHSEGLTTEMSVMTEVSDLEVVLANAQTWDFVDSDRIFLLGTSQGGVVSAIVGARHSDEVSGMVLLYPAFVIGDLAKSIFSSLDEVPDSFEFAGFAVGRQYFEDIWDYDFYSEIGNYKNKVLLLQGSNDIIVPASYTQHALDLYTDADYHIIERAGHGFTGESLSEANEYILGYMQNLDII